MCKKQPIRRKGIRIGIKFRNESLFKTVQFKFVLISCFLLEKYICRPFLTQSSLWTPTPSHRLQKHINTNIGQLDFHWVFFLIVSTITFDCLFDRCQAQCHYHVTWQYNILIIRFFQQHLIIACHSENPTHPNNFEGRKWMKRVWC